MRVLAHYLLWNAGLAKAWTVRTPDECRCLERHAAGRSRLVEIGCWYGVNTRRLRSVMAPEGVLFAVDPYPTGRLGVNWVERIAHSEVERSKNGTVRWVRATGVDAARRFVEAGEPPVDFLFNDSLNDYDGFRSNWEAWTPLVAPGGVLVMGTTQPYAPLQTAPDCGSVVFMREVGLKDPRFELLETVHTFTVLRRRGD